jgi:hypothetical protein
LSSTIIRLPRRLVIDHVPDPLPSTNFWTFPVCVRGSSGITSSRSGQCLSAGDATPEDLLAFIRGHWRVEHMHWLRDVTWKEDKFLTRTGNGSQAWSALTNLAITLFRIHGVTGYTAETRSIAQDSRRALHHRHHMPAARLNSPRAFGESLTSELS